ncbi:hypothetical protein [Streptomyces rubrogriseus]|uniref:hypothetical protein n=1 Tax=Streptomyces rubrogriseus TaxID=194673 RepID=UPI00381E1097
MPEGLKQALAPVEHLWTRLSRTSTARWLAKAVDAELACLRGLVGDRTGAAEHRLAERLERRLNRQGAQPIHDLAGWLIKRGLPQNRECWSHLCDDGIRVDDGSHCESCECLIADRRRLRTAVATRVSAGRHRIPQLEWRTAYERELQTTVHRETAASLIRRKSMAENQAAFLTAVERRKEAWAKARAAAATQPCADCGASDASGLCPVCTLRRESVVLVDKAVDIAVALRADAGDPQALAALTEQVRRDTWAIVRRTGLGGRGAAVSRAFAQRELAKRLLAGRRQLALERLQKSEPANAEAAQVTRMAQQGRGFTEAGRERALIAVERARERVAEELLAEFLDELYRGRSSAVPNKRTADGTWA